ncbi:MAG: roadblock/LC7 domain-containing protein [Candidatus Bathyarchaeota archaeon]|jgi:predicted regulator of Ras-like GTPase activity (Roadblock/LC7/MglB family)|nr:roadblock/LC7 domain-containing protein [Candidatus Bathyarchaeota archaeon]
MTASLEVDLVLDNLIKEFGESGLYFILITSENGAVIKSYISDEFNKNSIGLNMSQLYELAEEITADIGVHDPDFNIIHASNYYILSVKILGKILIVLMDDQIDFSSIFDIINKCIITN